MSEQSGKSKRLIRLLPWAFVPGLISGLIAWIVFRYIGSFIFSITDALGEISSSFEEVAGIFVLVLLAIPMLVLSRIAALRHFKYSDEDTQNMVFWALMATNIIVAVAIVYFLPLR